MVNLPGPKLSVGIETWPIAGQFTISRGAKTEAKVVVAELSHGGFPNRVLGRGECVPYARYGESAEAVAALLEGLAGQVAQGLTRVLLQSAMPAGAARNALDCAFWDLEAKQAGKPVHQLAGLPSPHVLTTAYTISLSTPDVMADAARKAASRPLLKMRELLASRHGSAVRGGVLVIASDGWDSDDPAELAAVMARAARRARRVVWLNPRAAAAGFEPLVGLDGGRAAVLRRVPARPHAAGAARGLRRDRGGVSRGAAADRLSLTFCGSVSAGRVGRGGGELVPARRRDRAPPAAIRPAMVEVSAATGPGSPGCGRFPACGPSRGGRRRRPEFGSPIGQKPHEIGPKSCGF